MTDKPWNVGQSPQAPPTGGAVRPAPVTPSPQAGPIAPPAKRVDRAITWSRPHPENQFAGSTTNGGSPTADSHTSTPRSAVTQQMFLPPVAPPGTAAPATVDEVMADGPEQASGRWGWRAFVAFLGGGVLAASGFAAALEFGDTEDSAAAPVVQASTSGSTVPPIVVEPPDLDTTEPVAFVAQVLGPSIVQVEVPNVGLGSGVVFDDGLVMTNHHVIDGATEVDVRTADGRVLPGEVLGSDARTDIAVISIGPGSGIPVAQLAVGVELEVGQTTVAIGSPFQLQQTVTAGIISSLNRPVFNGVGFNPMIQTDAAINQGNSGGALADRNGRVIGINTAIQTDGLSRGNVGVSFAVPIDTAKRIADRILAGEEIEAGFLGVTGGQTADGSSGVNVEELTEGSAADLSGVRVGDRIVTIDGAPVTSIEELAGLVQTKFPGDIVSIELFRDGERLLIEAVLGQR